MSFSVIEGDVVIRDANGNAVGVILDGAVYRLQTEAKVTNFPAVQPVSDNGGSLTVDATSLPLPTGAATETTLAGVLTTTAFQARTPSALVGGRFDVNTGAWLGSTAPTVGQKTMAASLPVALASDHSTLPVQIQPGTSRMGSVRLVDANDVALDLARDTSVPSGTRGLMIVGQDGGSVARAVDVRLDALDGRRRLQVEGKFTLTPPEPPPSTTKVTITFSGALSITTDQTDNYVIANGKRFVVQQIIAGCEGDTSERGSVVEVYYYDGTTEHLIERVYLNGFSTEVFPNTEKARDGTNADGNGTTKTIRIKRRRLSGSAQEVDFVVRGYEYTP